ncbi:N-acyl-D-amino-acid deacylase family protein [Quisquiliibacterium transsilvanicum]|uniref:N-acyl-D-aspartate/D-glutamate deacylase n=1 Tax=Quisquiliibacterium transsilvanicum TaxID=1549638 RepID=A0A7W8HER9_9BURK|nr:amidohydrolase family protein [Quisquiliibacterium transsilvanicum]MBB5270635.1 N-acyl-D-aspartate/D-glutamate deacylase [Quisquiliibacterium transsilvanicum]
MADYDLIIRGGTVHDGLGGAPRIADVAVKDGRIAAIGNVSGAAAEEIDARGLLVTPGFVDVHTHFDGQCTWENRLAPSSSHGVTSVVMGNCGVGFAPCRPEQRDMLVKVMEGVEDVPEVVMTEGLPWNWETFPEYLNALEARRFDVDVAAQLPHSALRVYVMGERAAAHEPPSAQDLATMRALTAEAVRAGALGVTTSRNMLHRTKAGELAPSLFSEEDELAALADGLKDAGRGVFQIIPAPMGDAASEFALMRRLAERSGAPLSYTLIQMPTGDENAYRTSLAALDEAAEAGLQMRAQVAPRPVGMFYGLDLSFHPFAFHPSYKAIKDLPLAERVARMKDPVFRAQLLSEQPEDGNPINVKTARAFQFSFPWSDEPDYEPDLAETIGKRARAADLPVEEYAYDLLLANDGKAVFYQPAANYREGNLRAVREMLGHPHTVVGLADGGAHYGMICDASFPTYFLQRWARDAAPAERIPLPQAIAALTSEPAALAGLQDRGRLVPGCKADLNLIDLERLRLHVPTVRHDLPAGGRRMYQGADGYVATIVSGMVTYRNGEPTGALPGQLVRGQREASLLAA